MRFPAFATTSFLVVVCGNSLLKEVKDKTASFSTRNKSGAGASLRGEASATTWTRELVGNEEEGLKKDNYLFEVVFKEEEEPPDDNAFICLEKSVIEWMPVIAGEYLAENMQHGPQVAWGKVEKVVYSDQIQEEIKVQDAEGDQLMQVTKFGLYLHKELNKQQIDDEKKRIKNAMNTEETRTKLLTKSDIVLVTKTMEKDIEKTERNRDKRIREITDKMEADVARLKEKKMIKSIKERAESEIKSITASTKSEIKKIEEEAKVEKDRIKREGEEKIEWIEQQAEFAIKWLEAAKQRRLKSLGRNRRKRRKRADFRISVKCRDCRPDTNDYGRRLQESSSFVRWMEASLAERVMADCEQIATAFDHGRFKYVA